MRGEPTKSKTANQPEHQRGEQADGLGTTRDEQSCRRKAGRALNKEGSEEQVARYGRGEVQERFPHLGAVLSNEDEALAPEYRQRWRDRYSKAQWRAVLREVSRPNCVKAMREAYREWREGMPAYGWNLKRGSTLWDPAELLESAAGALRSRLRCLSQGDRTREEVMGRARKTVVQAGWQIGAAMLFLEQEKHYRYSRNPGSVVGDFLAFKRQRESRGREAPEWADLGKAIDLIVRRHYGVEIGDEGIRVPSDSGIEAGPGMYEVWNEGVPFEKAVAERRRVEEKIRAFTERRERRRVQDRKVGIEVLYDFGAWFTGNGWSTNHAPTVSKKLRQWNEEEGGCLTGAVSIGGESIGGESIDEGRIDGRSVEGETAGGEEEGEAVYRIRRHVRDVFGGGNEVSLRVEVSGETESGWRTLEVLYPFTQKVGKREEALFHQIAYTRRMVVMRESESLRSMDRIKKEAQARADTAIEEGREAADVFRTSETAVLDWHINGVSSEIDRPSDRKRSATDPMAPGVKQWVSTLKEVAKYLYAYVRDGGEIERYAVFEKRFNAEWSERGVQLGLRTRGPVEERRRQTPTMQFSTGEEITIGWYDRKDHERWDAVAVLWAVATISREALESRLLHGKEGKEEVAFLCGLFESQMPEAVRREYRRARLAKAFEHLGGKRQEVGSSNR